MKARLNITIDDHLVDSIKAYAMSKNISVSELVENYFKSVVKINKRKKNIIDLVEKLEKPAIDRTANLKELYCSEQAVIHLH